MKHLLVEDIFSPSRKIRSTLEIKNVSGKMNRLSTGDTIIEIAVLAENIKNTIISLIFQNTALHICIEKQ
jgi:hypothetical protein